MIRGWVEIDSINHYILKDKTYLCNHKKNYKGAKARLEEADPFKEPLPNDCPQCKSLWRDALKIEMMREDGISEEPIPFGQVDFTTAPVPVTVKKNDIIKEIHNTKSSAISSVIDSVSALSPASIPFTPVVEDDSPVSTPLVLKDTASELLDFFTPVDEDDSTEPEYDDFR